MTRGRSIRTPEIRDALLEAVSRLGTVTAACNLLEIGRSAVYDWRRDDPEFEADLSAAQDRGIDTMEDEAVRRAVEGVDEPVFYLGNVVGAVRKYSDTLLMFTLKGRRPAVWKDRVAQEMTGKDGAAIQIEQSNARDKILARLANLPLPGPEGSNS